MSLHCWLDIQVAVSLKKMVLHGWCFGAILELEILI